MQEKKIEWIDTTVVAIVRSTFSPYLGYGVFFLATLVFGTLLL